MHRAVVQSIQLMCQQISQEDAASTYAHHACFRNQYHLVFPLQRVLVIKPASVKPLIMWPYIASDPNYPSTARAAAPFMLLSIHQKLRCLPIVAFRMHLPPPAEPRIHVQSPAFSAKIPTLWGFYISPMTHSDAFAKKSDMPLPGFAHRILTKY